ncbi:MAG: acyl-CoA dehydratase activase-related protein [Propionicimonas sp.]|uniref:acyl-CoA dehydratase activase-related protein n=1 Tax=Propionicimonas sp. TaxID=1955623 RepID=UPI003D0B3F7C
MDNAIALGLDIGSTTVKAVVLDGTAMLFHAYRRHNADARGALRGLLAEIAERFPGAELRCAVTGSAGLGVADVMKVEFVQEVIASTEAIERFVPQADVVIELGGEDAKITFLHPVVEQRMNGTCAGGTGAFIDQMATLLHTDAGGLDALAAEHRHLYPIASRCGVFAKSDLQPLLNQGAAHTDLAASVFAAVATQTIAGLACGHPIRGNVVFLGGPLHFLPQLRAAYERALADQVGSFTTPENAHLYVAIGAALLAGSTGRKGGPTPAVRVDDLVARLRERVVIPLASARLRPLFRDDAERDEFTTRHARASIPKGSLADASGPLFLGIDAGSTTVKAVLLTQDGRIVFDHYEGSNDPVHLSLGILRRILSGLPADAYLARACVTGYGEGLVRAALRLDDGEIETMAHYRAAERVAPGVTSVIDIGGQDMKYLKIRNGAVDSISVNEACSSGCGSFLQTFAASMGTDVQSFARSALASDAPVDLGTRCTVFMNSSVKQAQREGASQGDIAAGLSYSVVRNALYKVIKLKDVGQLGDTVVVQGGTFLNNAVLRAFELQTGAQVVRPDIAGLMGAYGAALTAQRNWQDGERTQALALEELDDFAVDTKLDTCRLCQNHCQLTISTFGDGTRHVSGNRCERGASTEKVPPKSELPNLFDYKYKRIFGYRRLTGDKAPRGDIGIPRVLNMYENYPLWFTILSSLGFRVTISGRSSHELFETGMESIASENVCYPAKLAHGHIEHLLDKGIRTIFYPCVPLEARESAASDNHFNCPVVAFYPQVIEKNLARLQEPGIRYLAPMLNLAEPEFLASRLVEVFADWNVTLEEATAAVEAGYAEDARVKADIRAEGRRALEYIAERGIKGIVLAGRPYHVDPEVNHGIPSLINGLGMAVLTEDAIVDPGETMLTRPLRVRDQWTYHTRLYEAAARVAGAPDLHLVQLNSFGCGVDAITTDQVQEILERADDMYTLLKIDEVSNLGAATIRLRSMKAAAAERRGSATISTFGPLAERRLFDEEARRTHTIYAPQMAPVHFRLVIPVMRKLGLNVQLLEHASADDIEVGLKYVNNDACFPAIMVVGQLVNKIRSGEADPDRTSVAITQTGGMCRATNYVGLLRKALADAGYPQVPVLAISVQGLEKNPGFKITPALLVPAVQALVLGDLLQTVLLRVRPYEARPGSAKALYDRWDRVCQEFLQYGGYSATLGRSIGYTALIRRIVKDFDALPLRDIPRKPRVGIVGEILVKFHPDANNHVVNVVEAEDCEAVLPGMLQFFMMPLYSSAYQFETLGIGPRSHHAKKLATWLIEKFQQPVVTALGRTGKFDVPPRMADLAAKADGIISLGTRAGEGWLLTAEMVELIEIGAPNIICAQPFACLPNHVVGRGMFAELRRRHPEANVVSVDYDPGASATNQLNRIKLMVATAHKRHGASDLDRFEDLPPLEASGPRHPRSLTITPVSPVDAWEDVRAGRR